MAGGVGGTFIPLKRKVTPESQPVRLGLTPCLKRKGGTLDVNDLEGRARLRNQRRGLHQHLPAKRLKQRRASTVQRGLDGRMATIHSPLSGRQAPRRCLWRFEHRPHRGRYLEPQRERQNSGLPHERSWFTDLLGDGWTDAFRACVGEGEKIYSWWSNRGQARAKDRGWRIDYFLLNPVAAAALVDCSIVRQGGLSFRPRTGGVGFGPLTIGSTKPVPLLETHQYAKSGVGAEPTRPTGTTLA